MLTVEEEGGYEDDDSTSFLPSHGPKRDRALLVIALVILILAVAIIVAILLLVSRGQPVSHTVAASYDIIVVGGGFSGALAFSRLSSELADRLLLLETDDDYGGRLGGHPMNPRVPGFHLPTGATHVSVVPPGGNETNDRITVALLALADELNVALRTASAGERDVVWYTRGYYTSHRDRAAALYAELPFPRGGVDPSGRAIDAYEAILWWLTHGGGGSYIPSTDTSLRPPEDPWPSTVIHDAQRDGRPLDLARWTIEATAGHRSGSQTGYEARAYLHDLTPTNAFAAGIDARSWRAASRSWRERTLCCPGAGAYPTGRAGMRALALALMARGQRRGGHGATNASVTRIDRDDGNYLVTLANGTKYEAKRVILAVPPGALAAIGGDVVPHITNASAFRDLMGTPVVTVTAVWTRRWWDDVTKPWHAAPGTVLGTVAPHPRHLVARGSCLGRVELPHVATWPHAYEQNVTRIVETDVPECVAMWTACSRGGDACLKRQVVHALRLVWPALDAQDAMPMHVVFRRWNDGRHALRAGTRHTNEEVFLWSLTPLEGEPLGLTGSAYHLEYGDRLQGAYAHTMHLLERMNIE